MLRYSCRKEHQGATKYSDKVILIFGGTTEGRIAADVCEQAAKSYLYSTKSGDQRLVGVSYAEVLSGAMDCGDIVALARQREVELIVDAAHPYAENLHDNIAEAASKLSIPIIRYERAESSISYSGAVYLNSMSEAVEYITSNSLCGVLALTGVKSAKLLSPISSSHRVILRIMDREESNSQIESSHFPIENIIYYDYCRQDDELQLCRELGVNAILTKDSGDSGGVSRKVESAIELGIPLLVIKRPQMPQYRSTVFGSLGLRRSIEQLLPTHFDLRTGFTTGSAATAATVAALKSLLENLRVTDVEIYLPSGEPIAVTVKYVKECDGFVEACVVKDGGDDPDATHNIEIVSRVRLTDSTKSTAVIDGGEGVGRVTLEGIGIDVGQPAINPVPRQMIVENVMRQLAAQERKYMVEVEISVPQGEQIALKTFNPRLGIVGGISILGTSGIVQPFSAEAFMQSIRQQIRVAKASCCSSIVINSGAMSERFVKAHYGSYPPQNYIHYGNLIGATIEMAASEGVEHVVLGILIGKAVKLAAGALDTHSKMVVMDHDFLLRLSQEAGCAMSTQERILDITTARQLWDIIPPEETKIFDLITQNCYRHSKPLLPNGMLEVLLLRDGGELVSRVSSL